jgi:hypothetical protein
VTATFFGPPLVTGTVYAAAISRPGTAHLEVLARQNNDCGGNVYLQLTNGSSAFTLVTTDDPDVVSAVSVQG